jgi:bifunctional DNA primase/polymerase-like protein
MTAAPSPYAQHGPRYTERGYSTVPIAPGTKAPGHIRAGEWRPMYDWGRFTERLPTRFDLSVWCSYPDAGVGVVCGGLAHLIGVDIDTDRPDIAGAIIGAIPQTTIIKKGAKGSTRFYRGPAVVRSKSWRLHGDAQVCDLIGPGRQTVVPGSLHPTTGKPYVWLGPDSLEDTGPTDLPELTPEHIAAIDSALAPFGYAEPKRLPERPATFECNDARGREYGLGALYGCADELAWCSAGRNNLLNILAGRLGRCIARGWLSEQECWAALWNAGVANGMLSDNGEAAFAATFASGLAYGLTRPMADPQERLAADPVFAARIKKLNAHRQSFENFGANK